MTKEAAELVIPTDLNPHFLIKAFVDLGHHEIPDTLNNIWTRYCTQKYTHAATLCQVLLDDTWEQLNTGHWKDVNISWRKLYSYAALLKCLSVYRLGNVHLSIKTCDMGLLMGAPIFDNILAKLAPQLNVILSNKNKVEKSQIRPCCGRNEDKSSPPCKRWKERKDIPVIDASYEIPRVDCPSLMTFHQQHMRSEQPVILQHAMDHWPALTTHRWNLDYIRSVAGARTVPIEVGSQYTAKEWTQKLVTVNEFIDNYISLSTGAIEKEEKGYLAQHRLFEQIPELRSDILVPDYCCLSDAKEEEEEEMEYDEDNVMIHAWFGPGGTISPLHHDPYHNLLAQVVGSKYIRLYDRSTPLEYLYPHKDGMLNNTSRVEVESWKSEEFPMFAEAKFVECVLEEGEMLYLPHKWWHYVRSLQLSFSVSFWWM